MTVQLGQDKDAMHLIRKQRERERERERDGMWLLSPCPLHHPISGKLNVRMTDAAHQRQVREVK